uniref:Uncharacterized protein n=1 Tax=Acrobeloides nanus TaxID=290746 RepID=A0A914CPC0_9BILA
KLKLRLKRASNSSLEENLSNGVPVAQDDLESHSLPDFATMALIQSVTDDNQLIKVKENVIGHPIASDEAFTTTTTSRPTAKTSPRVVILTRATKQSEQKIEFGFPSTLSSTTTTTIQPPMNLSEDKVSLYTKKVLSENQDKDVKEIAGKDEEDAGKTADSGAQTMSPIQNNFLRDLEQCSIFVAPGLGILFGHFPMSYTIHQIGAYRVMAIALAVSAITTAVMPFFYQHGFYAIAILRFIHGLTFSIAFTFIGTNAAKWGALKEQLTFITFSVSALPMAALISWMSSNYLLQLEHTVLVFVLHAIATLILLIIWLIFYRNTPQKHRWVNGLELNKIMSGKVHNRMIENKPTVSLIGSVSAWSIWMASFGYFFALSALFLFLPLYIKAVLQTEIDSLGTLIALPFITMLLIHYFAPLVNKCFNFCSLTVKIRVFNTIAFVGAAVVFIALAALFPSEKFVEHSLWIFIFTLLPLGLAVNGFYQSAVVVGRYYTQFIVSQMQVPLGLAMTLAPVILFFVTPENHFKYWKIFFVIIAAVLILTAVIFAVLGQGTPASWAERSWDSQAAHKMLDNLEIVGRGAECGIIEMKTIEEYVNGSNSHGVSLT